MADGGSERADGRIVKMEVDYSATVDQRLPECEKLAKVRGGRPAVGGRQRLSHGVEPALGLRGPVSWSARPWCLPSPAWACLTGRPRVCPLGSPRNPKLPKPEIDGHLFGIELDVPF